MKEQANTPRGADENAPIPRMESLVLKYRTPAADSADGWENESLPLGNGYLGANVFGIVERERIQITENSLENPGPLGGLNNFAELYLTFDHPNVRDYERGLCLDNATAFCQYTCGGVKYRREIFASYPDRVLVVRLTASRPGALSFTLCPEIPFIKDYAIKPGDGGGKSGTVTARGDTIVLAGRMHYYDIRYDGRFRALPAGGEVTADGGALRVERADSAVILFALGTNYRLSPHVFLENDPKRKLAPEDPGPRVEETLAQAAALGYDALRERHLADYRSLFGRVELELAGPRPDAPTDELLKRYGAGESIPYLEQRLLAQYQCTDEPVEAYEEAHPEQESDNRSCRPHRRRSPRRHGRHPGVAGRRGSGGVSAAAAEALPHQPDADHPFRPGPAAGPVHCNPAGAEQRHGDDHQR